MMKTEGILFTITWISLIIIGIATLLFGLIATVWPGSDNPLFLRASGVASIAGLLLSVGAFFPREIGKRV